eukprot:COSAG02_NODE_1507_length_12231_cov_56.431751_13_plen_156_part_01
MGSVGGCGLDRGVGAGGGQQEAARASDGGRGVGVPVRTLTRVRCKLRSSGQLTLVRQQHLAMPPPPGHGYHSSLLANDTLSLISSQQTQRVSISGDTEHSMDLNILDVALYDGHTQSWQKGRLNITRTALSFYLDGDGDQALCLPLENVELKAADA